MRVGEQESGVDDYLRWHMCLLGREGGTGDYSSRRRSVCVVVFERDGGGSTVREVCGL